MKKITKTQPYPLRENTDSAKPINTKSVSALTSRGIWSSCCRRGCAASAGGRSWHLGSRTPCRHPWWSQQAGCSGQARGTPARNEWLQPTVPSYTAALSGQLLKFVLVWVFGEGFSYVYLWKRTVKFLDASHQWNDFTTTVPCTQSQELSHSL